MNQHQNKNIRKILSVIIVLTGTISIQGCYYDKEDLLYPGSNLPTNCGTTAAKFAANVLPLIITKCSKSGCHDATASGGQVLQNYSQISAAKDRINARAVVEKSMPASGPLSAAEIGVIKCWIESGAPNN